MKLAFNRTKLCRQMFAKHNGGCKRNRFFEAPHLASANYQRAHLEILISMKLRYSTTLLSQFCSLDFDLPL